MILPAPPRRQASSSRSSSLRWSLTGGPAGWITYTSSPRRWQAGGEQARERGDQGTVSPMWLQTSDLTGQDRDLAPEDQDLRILDGSLRARSTQPNTRTMKR